MGPNNLSVVVQMPDERRCCGSFAGKISFGPRLQLPSERLTWLAPPVEGKELFTAPSAALGYKLLPTALRSRLIPLLTV